jgi:hypothetical protein
MAPIHATFESSSAIPAGREAGLYRDRGLRSPGLTVSGSSVGLDAGPDKFIRWLVGLVLIFAAILKAVELVTEPAIALTTGRMMLPLQIGVELCLGLCALTGLYWRHLRYLAAALFTAFAAYSLYLATTGATSCGCFGPVRIHPWWTFGLDLAILLALLLSIPATRSFLPLSPSPPLPLSSSPTLSALRSPLYALIIAVPILTAALLLRYTSAKAAAAAGVLTTNSGLVILEPEQWIGKQLPIANFIHLEISSTLNTEPSTLNPSSLMQGNWTVLLHRRDCPACQEALPRYEHLAQSLNSQPSSLNPPRIALIEVPPYSPSDRHLTPNSRHLLPSAHHGRLSADHEWFVETPKEVTLQGGIVTGVKDPGHSRVPTPMRHHTHGLPAFR